MAVKSVRGKRSPESVRAAMAGSWREVAEERGTWIQCESVPGREGIGEDFDGERVIVRRILSEKDVLVALA